MQRGTSWSASSAGSATRVSLCRCTIIFHTPPPSTDRVNPATRFSPLLFVLCIYLCWLHIFFVFFVHGACTTCTRLVHVKSVSDFLFTLPSIYTHPPPTLHSSSTLSKHMFVGRNGDCLQPSEMGCLKNWYICSQLGARGFPEAPPIDPTPPHTHTAIQCCALGAQLLATEWTWQFRNGQFRTR